MTALFSGVPEGHEGEAFTFMVSFSGHVPMSDVTMRDRVFSVTGGALTKASRVVKEVPDRNRSWFITV